MGTEDSAATVSPVNPAWSTTAILVTVPRAAAFATPDTSSR
jgi:hypothetical protein